MYKYILTLRYLKMRFLFLLSVLGVAAGVMVLMITISVMSGFLAEVQKLIRGVHADIDYLPRSSARNASFAELEKELLAASPKIVAASPHLQREVLVCTEQEDWSGGILIGIDYAKEIQTTNLENFVHTPYKQIWDEIRFSGHEGDLFTWEAVAFNQEGHFKDLYIHSVHTQKDREKKTFTHRLRFNDSDRVVDYALNVSLPKAKNSIPKWCNKWLVKQNKYIQEKKAELFMKDFSKEVTIGGRGLDLKNPFAQKDLPYPPIIIGDSLLRQLKLKIGEVHHITLMTAQQVRREKEDVIEYEQKFSIIGVFKSGLYEIDSRYLYAPIDEVQKFLSQLPYRYTSAYIKVNSKDHQELKSIGKDLTRLSSHFYSTTWKERKRNLLRVVQLQKNVISVILFFIILMAATTILFILLQLAFERKQDIGILKSMGASTLGISSIFCLYGLIIGGLGILLGLISGYLVLDHVNEIARFIYEWTGKEIFPRNIYHLNEIPTKIQLSDIFLVTLPTVFISILFSLPAAYIAARQDPIATLQSK